jgi:hypothetical protein
MNKTLTDLGPNMRQLEDRELDAVLGGMSARITGPVFPHFPPSTGPTCPPIEPPIFFPV